jgi:hypothetical protein
MFLKDLLTSFLALAAISANSLADDASKLVTFRACIATPSAQCLLDPATDTNSQGKYYLTSPLLISADNVIARGNGTVVLDRATGFAGPLMKIDYSSYLTGITIANFTFNGKTGIGNVPELEIDQTASASNYSTYNVSVTGNTFNTPGFAGIDIGYGAHGIYFHDINVLNSAIYGIHINGPQATSSNGYSCSGLQPTYITIDQVYIIGSGANGIITSGSNVKLTNSNLTQNHHLAPFNQPGGQLDIEYCADTYTVQGNIMTEGYRASNGYFVAGVEAYGTNLTFIDNVIRNNSGHGMYFIGAQNVTITATLPPSQSTKFIRWNNIIGGYPAIWFANQAGMRQSQNIFVQSISAIDGHTYGLVMQNVGSDTRPIINGAITNNCFRGNTLGGMYTPNMGTGFTTTGNSTLSTCAP